jgi:hypothetical protein
MAALAIAYRGSFTAVITNVCLRATSIVGVGHSLPTAPDIGAITRLVPHTNTSIKDAVSLYYDATTIYFENKGGQSCACDAWVMVEHSIIK